MIRGILFAFGTAIAWTLANAAIRRASQKVGAVRASLWGVLSGALLAALFSPFLDAPGSFSGLREIMPTLLFAGVSAVLAYGSLFYAFEHGALSRVAPITALWPLVSALISTLLGDVFTHAQLMGGGVITLGTAAVTASQFGGEAGGSEEGGGDRRKRRSVTIAALGAALGFGLLIPALARVGAVVGAFAATALVYGMGLLIGFPLARIAGHTIAPPPRGVVLAVVSTGALEGIGFVCVALARRSAPDSVVSPIAGIAAAMTVLYGWLLLGERVGKGALAGTALICVGAAMLTR